MKKLSIRLLTFLLVLTMVSSALLGCSHQNGGDADTTAEAAATTAGDVPAESTAILPDIPEKMWNRDFRVLGSNEDKDLSYTSFELVAEELTGDFMNDAVFERNEIVNRKYGITITQTLTKNTQDRINSDAASGEDNFDLVFAYINKVGGLSQKGYFVDMNDIEYIDFSKPWWNPEVNEAVSIKGHIFYTSSDFSLRDKNRISVMLVNDALRTNLHIDPIPELVNQGKWTAERLAEYVTIASTDLNGDGQHTKEDQYGLVVHSYNAFAALCFGVGIRFIGKDADDGLVLISNPDHDTAAIDKVLSFCKSETYMTPEKYDKDWAVSANTLKDGRALFASTLLSSVGNFNQACDFDFTVLPNPKFDESQDKYYTIPDIGCMLFAVPSTCKDTDFVGFALEALSYESTETTCVTYIELLCKSRNIRNADSISMINTIFNGIVYDGAIFYSDTLTLYSILNKVIPDAETNLFQRTLASYRGPAERLIANINAAYDKLN